MSSRTVTALTMAFLLIFCTAAAAGQKRGAAYVDDGKDIFFPIPEQELGHVIDVYPSPVGADPYDVEPAPFEPDNDPTADYALDYPSDGTGPVVRVNQIIIHISGDHINAGSSTDYIYMRFGESSGDEDGCDSYNIRLWGYWDGSDNVFPRGWTLTWDLAACCTDFLEDVPQDRWDQISLVTPSGDGLLIERVRIDHSGQSILDWSVDRWLDSPHETTLGCAAKIAERKLERVSNTDHAAVYFGALEIGKTNGYKYGGGSQWCSEFASWCLRKEGFMTPIGNIGTDEMEDKFSAWGRLYTRSQVRNKSYEPREGDYLSLWNGDHSAIFLYWIDSTDTITNSTEFRTLEGNTGGRVAKKTRCVGDIYRVGSAQ